MKTKKAKRTAKPKIPNLKEFMTWLAPFLKKSSAAACKSVEQADPSGEVFLAKDERGNVVAIFGKNFLNAIEEYSSKIKQATQPMVCGSVVSSCSSDTPSIQQLPNSDAIRSLRNWEPPFQFYWVYVLARCQEQFDYYKEDKIRYPGFRRAKFIRVFFPDGLEGIDWEDKGNKLSLLVGWQKNASQGLKDSVAQAQMRIRAARNL